MNLFTKIILFAFPCYIINDKKIIKIWKILIKKFDYFIVSLALSLLLLLKKVIIILFFMLYMFIIIIMAIKY